MKRTSSKNRRPRITRPARRNRTRRQIRQLFQSSGLTLGQVIRIFAAIASRDSQADLDQIADILAREAIADDFEAQMAYLCREVLIQLGNAPDAEQLGPDTEDPAP